MLLRLLPRLLLLQVDPERNLLYVRGQVPGPQGSFVLVRDAFRWKWAARQAAELPFPTHIGAPPPVTVAKRDGPDPYRVSLWQCADGERPCSRPEIASMRSCAVRMAGPMLCDLG